MNIPGTADRLRRCQLIVRRWVS